MMLWTTSISSCHWNDFALNTVVKPTAVSFLEEEAAAWGRPINALYVGKGGCG